MGHLHSLFSAVSRCLLRKQGLIKFNVVGNVRPGRFSGPFDIVSVSLPVMIFLMGATETKIISHSPE